MCSWCWGFSPVFDEIIQRYQNNIPIHILLGGLRPGNTKPFDAGKRQYILSHWQSVHERTGQPFNFDFSMPPDFTYDTEPASRAVRVVRQLAPHNERSYLKLIQEAFYVGNRDVTRQHHLRELAEQEGVDGNAFSQDFADSSMKKAVWDDFLQARAWGVDRFPTLVGQGEQGVLILSHGYQRLETLIPLIEQWISQARKSGMGG